jgi:hypothetical protein
VPAAVRVPVATLTGDPERRRVVELLVSARLLTTDDRTVALAHEALISAWPRLRAWLDEDVAGARLARHLAVAAEDWDSGGRADSDLYRGGRLEAALELAPAGALTPLEQSFLTASSDLAAAERDTADQHRRLEARQNWRLRRALAATAAGLVPGLIAGALAVDRSLSASRNARAAQVDRLVAQSASLLPTRRDLAALLAVEAYRRRPDAATRSALFGVLTETPGFVGYTPTGAGDDALPVADARMLDEDTLVAVAANGVVRLVSLDGGEATTFSAPSEATDGALLGRECRRAHSRCGLLEAWGWRPSRRAQPPGRLRRRHGPSTTSRGLRPAGRRIVAISANGARVAVGGYEGGRAVVYDVAGRTSLAELASVSSPAPDGVRVMAPGSAATAVEDRRTRGRRVRRRGATARRVHRGQRPGRGPRYRTGSSGRSTGRRTGTSNLCLALFDDGRALLSSGTTGLVRWDLPRGRPSWTVSTGPDACGLLAVHSEGGVVLCGPQVGAVDAFDLDTGGPVEARYDLQRGPLSALLRDAHRADPGPGQRRRAGDRPVAARRDRTDHDTDPPAGSSRALQPGRRHLLMDDGYDWRLDQADPAPAVVDAATGEVVARLEGYQAATWLPSSRETVAAWGHRWAPGNVVDLATGRVERSIRTSLGAPFGFAAAADSPRMLLWGHAEQAVYAVFDLGTGDHVWSAGAISPKGGALTPDGRTAVRLEGDRLLSTDVDSGTLLAEAEWLQAVAISPAGVMIGASAGGRLMRYDPRTLQPLGGRWTSPGARSPSSSSTAPATCSPCDARTAP